MNVELRQDEIPEYVLKTFQAGRCPAFVPGSLYKNREGKYILCPDTEGAVSLRDYLTDPAFKGLSAPIGLIKTLRLIVEAHMALNDWFIEDCFVSPEPGKVFISTARDAVMFTPGKGSGCEDQIKGILYYAEKELLIPGAGHINERFSSFGTSCFADKRGLLRFLSRWEEELRQ